MTNPYNYQLLKKKFNELSKPRLSVEDIAESMDVSTVYIYKILNGDKFYEPAVFRLADVLGVPREALLKKTKRRA